MKFFICASVLFFTGSGRGANLSQEGLTPSSAVTLCGKQLSSERISLAIVSRPDKHGLQYGDSFFRNYTMTDYHFGRFQTQLYAPPIRKTNLNDSSVVVIPFHGSNATISNAGSSLPLINDLISHAGVYAEVIDQPGSGNNTDFSPLNSLESTIEFYADYLKDVKQRAKGKPLVVIGNCYSSGFLIEVNKKNPSMISGMVLSALIVADHEMGLDYSIDVESKIYSDGILAPNPAVRARADTIYAELKWSHDQNPFGETPTLILIGQNDPFMTKEARKLYQSWAVGNPRFVKFEEVEGAGHGVLGPITGHPESTRAVQKSIRELIERASSVQN